MIGLKSNFVVLVFFFVYESQHRSFLVCRDGDAGAVGVVGLLSSARESRI